MKNPRTQQRTTGNSARRATTSRRRPTTGHARPRTRTTSRLARTLVDHDEIRDWAEQRDGTPAAVKGTTRGKGDVGMIRIDFPGYSGEGKLEEIDWDRWFDKFDASNLALLVQDKTAGGEISHFNKLVAREGAGTRRARQRVQHGKRAKPAQRTPRAQRSTSRTQRSTPRTQRTKRTQHAGSRARAR